MKKSSKKGKKIIIIITIVIILILVLGFFLFEYYKYKNNSKERDKEYHNLEKVIENITLKEDKIEYGTTLSCQELLNNINLEDKNIKMSITINNLNIEKLEYQFKKVGDIKINITLSKEYKYQLIRTYKENLIVKKELKIKVEDTEFPVIKGFKDKEIMVGDKIDLNDGIEATDPIDGELEVKIDGSVDTNKSGTYEIKLIAEDLNGNKTEEKFNVVVKEKTQVTPKPSVSNSNQNNTTNKNNNTNNNTTNNNTPKTDKSTMEGRLYLAREEAKKVIKNIIKPGMSDYDKALAIFNYLHNNVERQTNQSTEAYKTNFGNEAYAALVMKIAACSGFCKAVTLLCNEAGLQSKHINENAWSHQWNLVLINGEWIVLDSQAGIFGGTKHPLEE